MTFYQELQLNQAGSKNLLKKSETLKEKLYHMWVYLVKIAVTMAFCFFFVSIFSIRTESTQPVPQYLTAFPIPVKTDLLNADIQS